jgi:Sulfatase-modifying factor enzyme 1
MRSNKILLSLSLAVSVVLGCSTAAVYAGSISDTYTTGDTLTATMMTTIKSAVNDNNTRVTKLENGTADCPTGMTRVGPICVDTYEASITSATSGLTCSDTGNDCQWVAQSVAGVLPKGSVTWFQAQQACANAGKRLPTNAEWQMAAAGTPDHSICQGSGIANTGSLSSCKSKWGIYDMVGNVAEWVADWMQGGVNAATGATGGNAMVATSVVTDASYGSQEVTGVSIATAGNATADNNFPAAIYRGGDYGDTGAGVFFFHANLQPSSKYPAIGFRCVR